MRIPDHFRKLAGLSAAASICRVLFFSALLAVTVLSLLPTVYLPSLAFNIWDKIQHSVSYAVLTVLGLVGWPGRFAAVAVGMLAHGAAIEMTQNYLGWRTGDALDWAADAAGVLLAGLLVRGLYRSRN
jgi:VanZ family protein